MKRIKKLIEDRKHCRHIKSEYYIKWRVDPVYRDLPACSFFLIPTVIYNTYPYRSPWRDYVFEVCFLHWYVHIGQWCRKGGTGR